MPADRGARSPRPGGERDMTAVPPATDLFTGRYSFLDPVPDSLFDAVVNLSHGELRPRAETVVRLRDALLGGRLPPPSELAWPDEPQRSALLAGLARSAIVPYCDGNPAITDD